MSPGLLLQLLVSGLATGGIYGLIGIGFSLIFRMSGVLNFSHGDLVGAGIFSFLLIGGGIAGSLSGGAALIGVAAAYALIVAAAIGLLVRQAAVAPFVRASAAGWIAGTAGAGLVLRSLIGLQFQAEAYTAPDLIPSSRLPGGGLVALPGGGVLQLRDVVVLLVALLLALAFDRFLAQSRIGKAMRAAAEQPDAAQLVGIPPDRLQLVAWGIAGLLACVAGLLLAPSRPVTLELGVVLGLKGAAAAVIGRLGSARGAVIAGLGIGLLESLLTSGPLAPLRDLAALILLLLVMVGRPAWLGVGEEAVD